MIHIFNGSILRWSTLVVWIPPSESPGKRAVSSSMLSAGRDKKAFSAAWLCSSWAMGLRDGFEDDSLNILWITWDRLEIIMDDLGMIVMVVDEWF